MIYLEKVNENTFRKIIRMKLGDCQERYVASNMYSLAEAWLRYDLARPFAIMNDGEPVGFLMIAWAEDERTAELWRIMIDAEHQNKGYGKAAINRAIEYIKESNKFDLVYLSFVPANTVARNLYYSIGFRENGKMDGDEIIMALPLTDNPKVGMTIADEDDLEEFKEFMQCEKEKGAQIVDAFSDFNKLIDAIKKESILRFTIMGNVIGLSDGVNTLVGSEYQKYNLEVLEKVNEKIK